MATLAPTPLPNNPSKDSSDAGLLLILVTIGLPVIAIASGGIFVWWRRKEKVHPTISDDLAYEPQVTMKRSGDLAYDLNLRQLPITIEQAATCWAMLNRVKTPADLLDVNERLNEDRHWMKFRNKVFTVAQIIYFVAIVVAVALAFVGLLEWPNALRSACFESNLRSTTDRLHVSWTADGHLATANPDGKDFELEVLNRKKAKHYCRRRFVQFNLYILLLVTSFLVVFGYFLARIRTSRSLKFVMERLLRDDMNPIDALYSERLAAYDAFLRFILMVLFADRFADDLTTLLVSLFSAVFVADLIHTAMSWYVDPAKQRASIALEKTTSFLRGPDDEEHGVIIPRHTIATDLGQFCNFWSFLQWVYDPAYTSTKTRLTLFPAFNRDHAFVGYYFAKNSSDRACLIIVGDHDSCPCANLDSSKEYPGDETVIDVVEKPASDDGLSCLQLLRFFNTVDTVAPISILDVSGSADSSFS